MIRRILRFLRSVKIALHVSFGGSIEPLLIWNLSEANAQGKFNAVVKLKRIIISLAKYSDSKTSSPQPLAMEQITLIIMKGQQSGSTYSRNLEGVLRISYRKMRHSKMSCFSSRGKSS